MMSSHLTKSKESCNTNLFTFAIFDKIYTCECDTSNINTPTFHITVVSWVSAHAWVKAHPPNSGKSQFFFLLYFNVWVTAHPPLLGSSQY